MTNKFINNKEKVLNDISTFEHYKPYWDKIIFNIIDKGKTSIFDIQDYFEFNWNYREWEVFLDALAYFRYVDFEFPNLTTSNSDKYSIRKVVITKTEFDEIIKNRKKHNVEKITYNTVFQNLNTNLVLKIKQILPLVNFDGRKLGEEQENLIYTHIARDLVYATASETHMTIDHMESYCDNHPLQLNSCYRCKVFEIDNMKFFEKSLSKSMLVFGCCKNSELYGSILEEIIDDDYPCIELFSLSKNKDIKKNFQIVAILPNA